MNARTAHADTKGIGPNRPNVLSESDSKFLKQISRIHRVLRGSLEQPHR